MVEKDPLDLPEDDGSLPPLKSKTEIIGEIAVAPLTSKAPQFSQEPGHHRSFDLRSYE
jgi:hypothetical protein